MGTVGGNLFAPSPFGDLTVALLALDATVAVQSGYGARDIGLEEFLAGRDRAAGTVVAGVTFERPSNPDSFRYRKFARVKPKGASVVSIAARLPNISGRVSGARIAYGAMAPTADSGEIGRAGARRTNARRGGRRRGGRRGGGGDSAGDRRHRQRLVSPRGRWRAIAPAAARRGGLETPRCR